MLKTLGAQIKEFKKDSFLTPVFMILEVLMETIIPLMMASIIDNGVEAGDIHHIYVMGGCMVIVAGVSLFAGTMGGKYGARASAGFVTYEKQCMKIYRPFLFPTLTNSAPQVLSQGSPPM
jgi:ATP-binding cassette subfamily B multidrug efflux pump